MSSLKDWYRYVDSRARTRPEESAPEEPEGGSDVRREEQAAAEAGDPGETGERLPSRAAAAPDEPVVTSEEALDVWGDLFPPQRKAETKPTTAPLPRPAARLDELPVELPFARGVIDSPPAPQFPLPAAEAPIPPFDEFVSPFTPEPASAAEAALAAGGLEPAGEDAASRSEAEPPAAGDHTLAVGAVTGPEDAGMTSAAVKPSSPVAGRRHDSLPAFEAALARLESHTPSADAEVPEPPPAAGDGGPAGSASAPPAGADAGSPATDDPQQTIEEGQLPWRSPFRLPGPGRTVSSGAPSPRPEPIIPRAVPPRAGAESQEPEGDSAGDAEPRLVPGTEAWERERVDRLARTFRETLRVLEQSVTTPRAPVPRPAGGEHRTADAEPREPQAAPASALAPEAAAPAGERQRGDPTLSAPGAERPLSQPVESAGPPPSATPAPLTSTAPAMAVEIGAAPSAEVASAVPVAIPTPPPEESAAAEAREGPGSERRAAVDGLPSLAAAGAPVPAAPAPAPERRLAAAPPARMVSPATPDVLRNIEEAALIRQRLPQHMAMLLRIPTNEVAQHSYKSPFRETREDLIGRLLDPQLTLEEAARILGVCPTTVRRYTNRGMLQCHRTPGNQRRFRMSDVLQFLEQYGDRIDRAAEAGQFEEAA